MSYLIARIQKFEAKDVRGIESHDRRLAPPRTNPDVDPAKIHANYSLHKSDGSFSQIIKEKIAALDLKRALRKDANVMVQCLVTSDKAFFDTLSPEQEKEFFQQSIDFIKERYGVDNIISAEVHRDEKTPHMHVNFVPIVGGRVSCKAMFGLGEYKKLQDAFYAAVGQPWGLQRGEIHEDKRKHLSVGQYKLHMMSQEKATLESEKAILENEKTALTTTNLQLRTWNKSWENANNELQQKNDDLKHEPARLRKEKEDLELAISSLRITNNSLIKKNSELQQTNNDLTKTKDSLNREKQQLEGDLSEPKSLAGLRAEKEGLDKQIAELISEKQQLEGSWNDPNSLIHLRAEKERLKNENDISYQNSLKWGNINNKWKEYNEGLKIEKQQLEGDLRDPNSLLSIRAEKTALEKKLSELRKENERFVNLDIEKPKLENQINELTQTINNLNREKQQLEGDLNEHGSLASLRAVKLALDMDINSLKNDTNFYKLEMNSCKEERDAYISAYKESSDKTIAAFDKQRTDAESAKNMAIAAQESEEQRLHELQKALPITGCRVFKILVHKIANGTKNPYGWKTDDVNSYVHALQAYDLFDRQAILRSAPPHIADAIHAEFSRLAEDQALKSAVMASVTQGRQQAPPVVNIEDSFEDNLLVQ